MNSQQSSEQICLQVFNEVSAIVTHEMRNALSIINESAGLLEDLVLMAGDEGAIPSASVVNMTESIKAQVKRANTLMKDVNTYAHSGDQPVKVINVHEALSLMAVLTGRKAAQKKIGVDIKVDVDLVCEMNHQLFLTAAYLCLIGLYGSAAGGATIHIRATQRESGLSVIFSTDSAADAIPGPSVDPRLHLITNQPPFELDGDKQLLGFTVLNRQ